MSTSTVNLNIRMEKNLKEELDYYFRELRAVEKMLYETNVLDNDIVEVDCLGRKIERG